MLTWHCLVEAGFLECVCKCGVRTHRRHNEEQGVGGPGSESQTLMCEFRLLRLLHDLLPRPPAGRQGSLATVPDLLSVLLC